MMRTRRLHARLAYVVRVDNRASIKKYSAFGARHQREDLSAGYAPRQRPTTSYRRSATPVV